jgi:Capsule assembly protein Wzi
MSGGLRTLRARRTPTNSGEYILNRKLAVWAQMSFAVLLASHLAIAQSGSSVGQSTPSPNTNLPQRPADYDWSDCDSDAQGSPYIPVDSWIYSAMYRLYALGYVDSPYLNMRPWTRASVSNMLADTEDLLADSDKSPGEDEAEGIYDVLKRELREELNDDCPTQKGSTIVESTYTAVRGISGTPLRDSFHLGSSIVNDFGRPYAGGLNNYSGASGYAAAGRFLLYVRGEFQGSPSAAGYSPTLAAQLATIDSTTDYFTPDCWAGGLTCTPLPPNLQATIPAGPLAKAARGRFLEAYVSAQFLNHVISFGKQDFWQSPAVGGSMSYSNNAENLYSFRINRIEPLMVPGLSHITGPFRYEFMIGPLKGHSYPVDPWVHIEKVSFRPTENFELGFERTVIWGGKGHEPVNLKTFLRGFFSVSSPLGNAKNSVKDPGARFGAFDFSYRLPFVRNWLMLYSDGEVHDDVSPIDAPRRAAWRPGLYLSHVPGVPKLDIRVESVWTDPPVLQSSGGQFMYREAIQRQGYTNSGQIFGDWIGREGKGGQGWITYHLSGNEWIQIGVRNQKVAKDFIPGGTTLNDFNVQVVKRIKRDIEIKGDLTVEHYKAPVYLPGQQAVTAATVQVTWFPGRKVSF